LNEFLQKDALPYFKERLAVTHLLKLAPDEGGAVLGYYSLLSDKLAFDPSDAEQKKEWKRFNKKNEIPFRKNRKSYPAMKIGRLAVAKDFAGQGLGSVMIRYALDMVMRSKDIAIRFVTIDAYETAFRFYIKNGFDFLSERDAGAHTRQMYFDLKRITEAIGE
jgi:GNAT superfamily N-acetyltransferase